MGKKRFSLKERLIPDLVLMDLELASPGLYRTLTTLLLLAPNTPMLFMGQEYAAAQPFLYFADNEPGLAASVLNGRIDSLGQFPSLATSAMKNEMADPSNRLTFERCQLDPSERSPDNATYRFHRDLLRMRRDPPFNAQEDRAVDGAVLSPDAFVLRWLREVCPIDCSIVNLGPDLRMMPAPEPLLGPPEGHAWGIHWSSENPDYQRMGISPLAREDGAWQIPGQTAIVLTPLVIARV